MSFQDAWKKNRAKGGGFELVDDLQLQEGRNLIFCITATPFEVSMNLSR
jgi:hypothetical protein